LYDDVVVVVVEVTTTKRVDAVGLMVNYLEVLTGGNMRKRRQPSPLWADVHEVPVRI